MLLGMLIYAKMQSFFGRRGRPSRRNASTKYAGESHEFPVTTSIFKGSSFVALDRAERIIRGLLILLLVLLPLSPTLHSAWLSTLSLVASWHFQGYFRPGSD
jgi:hypothetical protein